MESKDSTKKLMFAVDQISTFVGKGAGWLIIVLMVMVCIDVFRRYVLNAPSAWIGELSVMSYGAVIMLSGAYTLAQNGHVRGDFLYGSMKPRTQATLDLILYIVFFSAWYCGAVLCRVYVRSRFLAYWRTYNSDREWTARLSFQIIDSYRRRSVNSARFC